MHHDEDTQLWRLVKEDTTGEMEEIIFTLTGVILTMNLLPDTRDTA